MRIVRLSLLWLLPLSIILLAKTVSAQTATSRITGTVLDPTGAVIQGAVVTAKNEATGVEYKTTTTSAGTYALESLPVGSYTITVEYPGFRTYVGTRNVLTIGAPLVVNVTLEVGQPTEVVEVTGAYERIETSHAMLGGVVTQRAIVELPLNGRNPLSLIILEPGLVQRTTGAAGSGTHVFGSRDRAHNVTIDGIDANESSVPNPQNNVYRLNPDNVQEYRVVTHNATPEFGRNSGANVNIVTRSGTNEFHGDFFWFHRNTVLNANEWFNNASGLERPTLLLHQFGASGGGPIVKNKTFFFVSWQGNRIRQTMPIAQSFGVPLVYTDTLKKQGIFRYFVPDPANPLILDGVLITRNSPRLVDPITGALRPGVRMCATPTELGCIRTYNIFASDPAGIGPDPLMREMLAKFPSPNTFNVGDGLNTAGFIWNPPSRFKGPHNLFRIDHKFDENNSMFGRLLLSDWDTREGDFLNARPSIFPGFAPLGEVSRESQGLALNYRRVISSRMVNEFTTGFSRFMFTFLLREANTKFGVEPPPYGQECFGDDSLSLVDTPFCNTPFTRRAVSTIQFIDNLSYVRGAHSIRTGINFRLYRHNDNRGVPGGFNMWPTIIFSQSVRPPTSNTAPGVAAGFPGAPGINPSDNVNLQQAIVELMGIPARVQQAFVADFKRDQYLFAPFVMGTRVKQYNFYAQDEWRLRRNFTLTYGFRWEINLPPKDCCDRVFVPDRPLDGSQGPVTYVPSDKWFRRTNWTTIAPRVSFAWDPRSSGKMAIRMGYGIAFDTISTFQVTAISGMIPGSVLRCIVNVQDPPTGPCRDIPNDVRLSQLMAQVKPLDLGPVTRKPSELLQLPERPLGLAPQVGAFDPNLKVPTVHEWSLTIQRELPHAFVGQVGYIGKRGMRLYRAYDLNQFRYPPEFLQEFLNAQKNIMICKLNPDACLAAQAAAGIPAASRTVDNFAYFGLPGQVPLPLLSRLLNAPSPTSARYRGAFATDVLNGGVGDLAVRIDQLSGTDWIVNRGFPANYFRPNAQFGQIFYFDSGGSSSYHGMIVQLQRRYEKGLTFGLSYTLSKSIDDMSVDPVAATSGGGLSTTNSRTPTDVRNFKLDRARSDFDNRHVLVVNWLYDMPFGRGQRWGSTWPGLLQHLLGGWTVTGIYIYQSGEPYTLNSGVRTVHQTKQSRAEVRGPMPKSKLQFVPGIQGPVVFHVSDRIVDPASPFFNCRQVIGTESYFCIPAPGQHGMGRNAVQGPGFWNLDMGLIKKFQLTERVRLDFRTEFFNVFNHPNFENPRNASVGSPTITSSLFGQTCCVTAAVPSSATIIATGEPNRVIQFALKLSF